MADNSISERPSEDISFEAALKRLEDIVHSLEDGKLGLADALKSYEEGVKLLRQSYELLQRAERKIELLSGVDAEGNPITQPFDDSATFNPAEPNKRRNRRRQPSTPPECGPIDPQTGLPGMDEP